MQPSQACQLSSDDFRKACGTFATGVTVITTLADGVEHGMTANAFMSISLDPPLIAISIAGTARMLNFIRSTRRFAVSVLPEQSEDVAWHFAGRSRRELIHGFAALDGLPIACEVAAAFAADVVGDIPAGDHVIFIGRVTAMQRDTDARPLVFHCGKFGGMRGEHSGSMSAEALLNAFWWGFGAPR